MREKRGGKETGREVETKEEGGGGGAGREEERKREKKRETLTDISVMVPTKGWFMLSLPVVAPGLPCAQVTGGGRSGKSRAFRTLI